MGKEKIELIVGGVLLSLGLVFLYFGNTMECSSLAGWLVGWLGWSFIIGAALAFLMALLR